MLIRLLVLCSVFVYAGFALAQDKAKGPACEDQLAQATVQSHNLDTDRDQKERALAQEQVTSYMLRQQVAQLQKQIVDMKKMLEPKAEEPKK